MWAVQYHRYGDPSVLKTEEVAVRKPKPGEVMVETVSSGVSAIDLMYRSGKLRMHGVGFPKQTGFDVLGIVRESRVPGIEADRWVWAVLDVEPLRRRGTAVQYLTVGSERIGAFPEEFVPPAEAGSLPLGSLTALRGIRDGVRARRRIGAIAAGHKAAELTELAQLVAAGNLRPVVDRTYAVTDLARAHEEFGKGGTAGSRLICHTMP